MAPSCRSGMFPPVFSTTLSAAVLPAGTAAHGRLGTESNISRMPFSASDNLSAISFCCSLRAATVAFAVSACSFCPCFIRAPMDAASFLSSAAILSFFSCCSRRMASRAITLFIASLPSKPFTARRSITPCGFSFIC